MDGTSWANAFSNLNDALSAASAVYSEYGHNVKVYMAEGTYYGDTSYSPYCLYWATEGVDVYGGFVGNEAENYDLSLRDFSAHATILDGRGLRRIVSQTDNFSTPTIWDGITFTHGYADTNQYWYGGAVYAMGNMTYRNCTFTQNSGYAGGAIFLSGAIAENCLFSGNHGFYGGAVIAYNNSTIQRCRFDNNTSNYSGGAIYNSSSTIYNSLIANNSGMYGGGIYCESGNNARLYSCDIVNNKASNTAGGIYNGTLYNCVVWGNKLGDNGNQISNSTCYNSGIEGFAPSAGNIALNSDNNSTAINAPHFTQPSAGAGAGFSTTSADWTLQEGSFLINMGNNNYYIDTVDLAGNARVQHDTIDIGCYESPYSASLQIPSYEYNIVFVTPTGAGNMDGTSWSNAYGNLQEALNMASIAGVGTMWVKEGVYYGDTTQSSAFTIPNSINVYGGFGGNEDPDNFNIYNRDLSLHASILDGQNVQMVLNHPSASSSWFQWDGFTVRNGNSSSGNGGGAYVREGLMLNNFVFTNNYAASGGAVSLVGGQVNNSEFYGNSANFGGGIQSSSGSVFNCKFHNNTAATSGGAMYVWSGRFYNCLFANNEGGYGGAVYADGRDNYGYDGGYYYNCTFVNNKANTWVGGVYGSNGGGSFNNCILWGNRAMEDTVQLYDPIAVKSTALEATPDQEIFSGCIGLAEANNGSDIFSVRFVSPTDGAGASFTGGDWHLAQNSICINHGDNNFANGYYGDLDGNERIQQEYIDMGCYESPYQGVSPYSDGIVYVKANATGSNNGSSWSNAYTSLSDALSTALIFGSDTLTIWVAAGTYYGDTNSNNAFTIYPGIKVYGGFAGNESATFDINQRNLVSNVTILDGQNSRRVLYQESYNQGARWDGFTITNGYSDYDNGAGARLNGATLSNCIVVGNATNGTGGGVYMSNGARLENVLVYNNSADYCAGVYTNYYGYCSIVNTTIVKNHTNNSYGNTTGIYLGYGNTMYNSVVWGNYDSDNNSVYNLSIGSYENMRNCAVEGDENYGDAYAITLSHDNEGAEANANYPMFADPDNGDFSILEGSALIDAGDSSYSTLATDLAGNTRVYGSFIDIGCYEADESGITCRRPFDLNVSGITNTMALLSWTSNNETAPALYVVENLTDNGWQQMATATTTSVWLSGLTSGANYIVRVCAVCNAGDTSNYSSSVQFAVSSDCGEYVQYLPEGYSYVTDYGYMMPFSSDNNYSYTQQMYTSNELDTTPGLISAINFMYFYGNPTTRDLDIYLCQTKQTSPQYLFPTDSLTLVYSGNVTFNNSYENYWNKIALSQPFEYDGSSNLVLVVKDNTGTYANGNSLFYTNYGYVNGYSPSYTYYSSIDFTIDSLSGGYGYWTYYRNIVRFNFACEGDCYPPGLALLSVDSNNATISWRGADNQPVEMEYRNGIASEWTPLQLSTTSGSITLSGLPSGDSVFVRARSICNSTELSSWSKLEFVTTPSMSPIVYVAAESRGLGDGSSWSNAMSNINLAQQKALKHGAFYGTNADVWVEAGTYYGDSVSESAFTTIQGVDVYGGFAGNEPVDYNLSLRDFETNASILDGQHSQRVLFQQDYYYNDTTTWNGFTLTHGKAANGGGAYLRDHLILENCRVVDNDIPSSYYRNGIGIYSSGATIRNCVVSNNAKNATNNAESYGGGIYGYGTFVNCVVTNNMARYGGGMYLTGNSRIINCLIAGNSAYNNYGGVYFNSYSSIVSSNIVNNHASTYGGIYVGSSYSYDTIANTVVWGNTDDATTNYDNYYFNNIQYNYFYSCAIQGMEGVDSVINLSALNEGIDDNINYPIFADPDANDYRLVEGSALIDAGDNNYVRSVYDIAGNARVVGSRIDIGCSEGDGNVSICRRPVNARIEALDKSSALVAWQAPLNSVSDHYEVWLADSTAEWQLYTTTTSLFEWITGLQSGARYSTRVRAVCDANSHSSYSPTLTLDVPLANSCVGDEVVVGDGTSLSYLPSNTFYNYSITQQLYTAKELGYNEMDVVSLSFQYNYSQNDTRLWDVWLGTVNDTVVSSWMPASNFTQVFSDSVYLTTGNEDNWVTIMLATPYHYDATGSLVVTVNDVTGIYHYSPSEKFQYHTANVNRTLYQYNDGSAYNPESPSSYYNTTNRSNIKFGIECNSDCQMPNLAVVNIDSNSALAVYHTDGTGSIEMQIAVYGDSIYMPLTATGGEVSLTGLDYNTEYVVRVRQLCSGVTEPSNWRLVRFTTLPSASPIVYVAQTDQGSGNGSSWSNAMSDINKAQQYAARRGEVYGTNAQVWVAGGTYTNTPFRMYDGVSVYGGFAGNEPVDYDLSLRDFAVNATVLDGHNQSRVLYANTSFNNSTTWSGFTVRNGYSNDIGSGVLIYSNVVLDNFIVRDNYSMQNGGGIYSDLSGNIIQNSVIVNNRSRYNGGGIFSRNSTNVVNCLIANNSAAYASDSTYYSSYNGGGIYGAANVYNSTIVNNKAYNAGGISGVSYTCNTIIWGNVSYNDASNGSSFNNVASDEAFSGTNVATIAFDNQSQMGPRFVYPTAFAGAITSTEYADGDWHMLPSSYCIDRGDNSYYHPNNDLDGNQRIQNDIIDLGCYENSSASTFTMPFFADTIVYVTDGGAGTKDGTSWNNAMADINEAVIIAKSIGAKVWIASGVYYGNMAAASAFTAIEGVDVYGGFAGFESADYDLSLRDLAVNQTILDGQNMQRVLNQPVGFNNIRTTWDGVVLQNGYSMNGAGAYLRDNFTLKNSIVRNNTSSGSYGAGIYTNASSSNRKVEIVNSEICSNSYGNSYGYGAGVFAYNVNMTNCRLHHNSASYGAAFYRNGGSNYMYNCIIDHNQSSYGAVYGYNYYYNCDIVNNTSTSGAAASYDGGYFYNSIIWGNRLNGGVSNFSSTSLTVVNCAVEGGYENGSNIIALASTNDGADPTYYYPRFINPDAGDYQLHVTSNLIDLGDNSYVQTDITTDYIGNARINGTNVDLGACEMNEEYNGCPPVTNLQASNITTSTAMLTWSSDEGQLQWVLSYAQVGSGITTTVTVDDTVYNITGLAFNRDYSAQVRAVCDSGMTSTYSIPVLFSTTCDPTTLDTLSNFTSFSPADSTIVYNSYVTFSWTSLPEATSYDLYLWNASNPEPSTPTATGLTMPSFSCNLPAYNYGVQYKWRVVAWNECINKESPVLNIKANSLPDLHVSAITNSTPVANQTMTVTWTVVNDGEGNTPPGSSWNDYIWISGVDGVGGGFWYNVDEQLLATVPNLTNLNAGESYTNSATVTIPEDYIGGYYLFVITNAYAIYDINFQPTGQTGAPDPYAPSATGSPYPYLRGTVRTHTPNVNEGDNRNDNFFYKVLNILPPPSPDLYVNHISYPTNIFSGDEITIQWTVLNQGDAAALGTWNDAVYIQPAGQETLDLSIARHLATVSHEGTLATTAEYNGVAQVTIPIEYMGGYTIFVTTDVSNQVYESIYEGNNTSASEQTLNVTLTPPANLAVSAVTFPETVTVKGSYEIGYTVTNVGSSATYADHWTDKVILSPSTSPNDTLAIVLATLPHYGVLELDSAYVVNHSVTIPNISGSWYIFVYSDANNDVFEYTFETDNIVRKSNPVSVVTPDLVVSDISLLDGDLVPAGTITVAYTVTNNGQGAVLNNNWNDVFYITSGTIFAQSPTQLQIRRKEFELAAGASYNDTVTLTLPVNLNGDCYLWLYTDRQNYVFENNSEENNLMRYDDNLHILLPDLVVSSVVVPDTINANNTFNVSWTIVNQGEGAINGRTFKDVIKYNNVTIYEATLTNITLAAGDSLSRTAQVFVPCNGAAQNVITVTTDASNQIGEGTHEANNTLSSQPITLLAPDLAGTLLAPEDTLWSGTNATIRYTLTNSGNTDIVDRTFRNKIYFNTSALTYNTNHLAATFYQTLTLAAGATDTFECQVLIPEGSNGNYYMHLCVNDDTAICEGSNTAANISHSTVVAVTLSPYPDLRIASVTVPVEANIGEAITVTYAITNQGIGDMVNRSFTNKFYYSQSASVYNPNNLLTAQQMQISLTVGDTMTTTATMTLPATLTSGNYYIYAVADANNDIYEHTFENNNAAHSPQMFVKQYQLDLTAFSLTGTDAMQWGETVTYTMTVKNNSDVPTLAPIWVDEVYLSTDANLLTTDDTRLLHSEHRTTLLPDSSYSVQFNFTVPMGTPANAYLIAVTDLNNSNPDIDASNNLFVKPITVSSVPTADLVVTNVTVLDEVVAGQQARLVYTVDNISEVDINRVTWSDKVFLSSDAVYNSTDIEIGSRTRSNDSVAAGGTYTDTLSFTVPIPYQGSFNILVRANAGNNIYETNTANNVLGTVTNVTLPLPGDLVVEQIIANEAVVSGSFLNATWYVTNIGDNTLTGNKLRSLVYLSADTLFDASDRMLGYTESNNVSLAHNQQLQQSFATRISGVAEGNYHVIVKTNATNSFNEVTNTNNSGFSVLPTTVTVRALAFNTPTSDTLYNDLPSDFKLNVGDNRNETVRIHVETADSALGAVNMIYVSYNTIGDNLNYTYSTTGQYQGNSELFIPSTLPGYYGINLYGSTPAGESQQAVVTADIIPFDLRGVNPSYGGNSGKVTIEITGSRFRPEMTVWLANDHDTIFADSLIYVNYYQSYVQFDLTGRDTGYYDVGVLNFCEGEAILSHAFEVRPGAPDGLAYNLVFPNSPRPNRNVVMMLEFGNTGNVDITGAVLTITSVGGSWIATTPEGINNHNTVIQVPLTIEGEPEGLLRPGSYGTIMIYGYTSGSLVFTINRVQ